MKTIEPIDLSGLDAETALRMAAAIAESEVDVRMGERRLQLLRAGLSPGDADRVVDYLREEMRPQLDELEAAVADWIEKLHLVHNPN